MAAMPSISKVIALLLLVLLLAPGLSQSQQLLLSWDFPRDVAVDNFILAQTESGKPERQARVPLSAEGACVGSREESRDTFCTVVTPCPAPGTIVAYWVYAQRGNIFSAPTNILTCSTTPGQPCRCVDPLDVAPQAQTPPPPGIPLAQEMPPPALATMPPAQVATAAPPLALATASPTVPLLQIPAAPTSTGA